MNKYSSLLLLSFICAMAQAKTPTITVFTDKLHPIDILGMNVKYYEIDSVQQFIDQLNSSLRSLTKVEARIEARSFLNQHQAELLKDAEGLAKAQQLHITQLPAIVFDNQAVIYGQSDLSIALAEYRQWQRTAA